MLSLHLLGLEFTKSNHVVYVRVGSIRTRQESRGMAGSSKKGAIKEIENVQVDGLVTITRCNQS